MKKSIKPDNHQTYFNRDGSAAGERNSLMNNMGIGGTQKDEI